MTKWKQRRMELEKQRHDFAIAALPSFLTLFCEKAYNVKLSKKETEEVRDAMFESAWSVANQMLKAREA